jgi:uncharacterized FlaG/YvyC family protein
MEIGSMDRADGNTLSVRLSDGEQIENGRAAFSVMRQLASLNISDREFAVVRDPASHRFVVHVMDRGTGTVLDQFPPETILKMLSDLQSIGTFPEGKTKA